MSSPLIARHKVDTQLINRCLAFDKSEVLVAVDCIVPGFQGTPFDLDDAKILETSQIEPLKRLTRLDRDRSLFPAVHYYFDRLRHLEFLLQ